MRRRTRRPCSPLGASIHALGCPHPPTPPPLRRDHARSIPGKSQLFINAFARALEVIPRQLADNSGFDATDVLNRLRQKHAAKDDSGRNFGIDVNTGPQGLGVCVCVSVGGWGGGWGWGRFGAAAASGAVVHGWEEGGGGLEGYWAWQLRASLLVLAGSLHPAAGREVGALTSPP